MGREETAPLNLAWAPRWLNPALCGCIS